MYETVASDPFFDLFSKGFQIIPHVVRVLKMGSFGPGLWVEVARCVMARLEPDGRRIESRFVHAFA